MVQTQTYIGSELSLFAKAQNWKAYFHFLLGPYLRGDVLEVGAGIGATAGVLCRGHQGQWTCLEPDVELAASIRTLISEKQLPSCCEVIVGTIAEIHTRYDVIVYIDVLEHVKNDKDELEMAARLLKQNGFLVVLSPAHQWLYSPFDREIGHFRRYDRRTLVELTPSGCRMTKLIHLDSVGLLASLGNRMLLRRSMPTPGHIALWDRRMVPISRIVDCVLRYRLGKSILAIWQRT